MAPKLDKTEARQGRTFGEIRWVLVISVALAAIALYVAYLLI
jgi:hypothetical protein